MFKQLLSSKENMPKPSIHTTLEESKPNPLTDQRNSQTVVATTAHVY